MSKVFLDTNILVYSMDQSDAGKRKIGCPERF
jgi:predicted nucleic acid-binding protein